MAIERFKKQGKNIHASSQCLQFPKIFTAEKAIPVIFKDVENYAKKTIVSDNSKTPMTFRSVLIDEDH